MNIQALSFAFLAATAVGGLAWVFVYPLLSGEKKAENRRASVAKSEPAAQQPPDAGRTGLVNSEIHDRFRHSRSRVLCDGDAARRRTDWRGRPGIRRRLRSATLGLRLSQEAPGKELS